MVQNVHFYIVISTSQDYSYNCIIRIHLIFCFNNRPPKNSKPDPILTDEEEEEDSELIEAKIVLRDVSTTGKSILS